MSTQFIYQPHIHAGGMTITPDLPLSRLMVSLDGTAQALPARRIATDLVLQAADIGTLIRPALALVAASEGTLVAPAAVLVPGSALAAADISLSRQAWRLADASGPILVGWDDEPGVAVEVDRASMAPGSVRVIAGGGSRNLSAGPHRCRIAAGDRALAHRFEIEILGQR